jgi:hypothetical protein
MKIEVSESELHILAEAFASNIHAAVVTMHLRQSWGIWESRLGECPYRRDLAAITRIRAALRSIEDPLARYNFHISIRCIFHKLRRENGTDIKWQDYVSRVRQAYADHQRNKLEVA